MATELCSSQPGHLCCTKAAVPIAYKYHTEEVSLLPAGLYLPTSDVDLVILDSGCTDIVSGLRALAQCLVRRSLATGIQVGIRPLHLRCIHHRSSFRKVSLVCSLLTCPSGFPIKTELVLPLPGVKLMHWLPCWGYIAYHGLKLAQCSVLVRDNSESFSCHVQIIAKAKVPIIKFKEAASGLDFDVSFNAANGPQAAEYVRELMQRLPPMRSLILVIKVFLHQRELNEVGPTPRSLCIPYPGGSGEPLQGEAPASELLLCMSPHNAARLLAVLRLAFPLASLVWLAHCWVVSIGIASSHCTCPGPTRPAQSSKNIIKVHGPYDLPVWLDTDHHSRWPTTPDGHYGDRL